MTQLGRIFDLGPAMISDLQGAWPSSPPDHVSGGQTWVAWLSLPRMDWVQVVFESSREPSHQVGMRLLSGNRGHFDIRTAA